MKTKTVEYMISHAKAIKDFDLKAYTELVTLWKQFARGGTGVQLDAWNPETVRSTYYVGWSDADFVSALEGVEEAY